MFFVVILVVLLLAAGAVRLLDPRDPLATAGVVLTVIGALTTLLMWWLRVPVLILVVGLGLLAFRRLRPVAHQ